MKSSVFLRPRKTFQVWHAVCNKFAPVRPRPARAEARCPAWALHRAHHGRRRRFPKVVLFQGSVLHGHQSRWAHFRGSASAAPVGRRFVRSRSILWFLPVFRTFRGGGDAVNARVRRGDHVPQVPRPVSVPDSCPIQGFSVFSALQSRVRSQRPPDRAVARLRRNASWRAGRSHHFGESVTNLVSEPEKPLFARKKPISPPPASPIPGRTTPTVHGVVQPRLLVRRSFVSLRRPPVVRPVF